LFYEKSWVIANASPFHFTLVTKQPVSVRAQSTVSAPKRESDPKKRVVITGMGLCSCFGNDVDVFYDNLLAGNSGVDIIDRFDPSKFPTKFAAQIRNFSSEGLIDPKNDRRLDDCLRYAIVSGKKALIDAGLGEENLKTVMPI
jgi:3-oxoacyl-[acyl-carrier-protein] synthase II